MLCAFLLFSCHEDTKNKEAVFIDTDCGIDDIIAIELLLNNNENIKITGISCVHGLTNVEDGVKIIKCLLEKHDMSSIPVFSGANKPYLETNPFPKEWKTQATEVGLEVTECNKSNVSKEFNPKEIIKIIENSNSIVLTLGPLTNIKTLLDNNLSILTETICMGGAINVVGNLKGNGEFETSNLYAEWNFYADPIAAKFVLDKLDNLLLIPLDATNDVMIDSSYLNINNWKNQSTKISHKILKSVENWISEGQHYAWDPLAAATIIDDDIVVIDSAKLSISLQEEDKGRVIQVENGNYVRYGKAASKKRFDDLILKQDKK